MAGLDGVSVDETGPGRRRPSSTLLRSVEPDRLHLVLMSCLTFTTGVNDALGYLGFGRVFTGNMTGNVVVLGMALAGGDDLPVLGPTLALIGFMVGAALGGRTLKTQGPGWTRRTTALLLIVATTMVAIGSALIVLASHAGSESLGLVVTTAAATAMGIQAATARVLAVKDVTTVVVTSAITGLAADSVFGARVSSGGVRRAMAVALILLGATAGTLMLRSTAALGFLIAGVLIATVALIGHAHPSTS